ncbi:ATP-binding protein [Kitasatospora sp. NPDC101801]|uniref:ATP-binding protein n=1 Tax=Kitasatospora sp. NPDC101801 TaxID=3364103 RepID=UPI003813F8FE
MISSTHARRISFIGTRRDHVPPAREAVVRVARSWGIDPTSLGDIALVADELLANAVIHAPGRLLAGIYLSPDGDRVVIEVYDPSRRMPTGAANFGNDELTTGRGMLLIEGLSETWGAEPTTHGKKVWAELAVPAVAVPEHPRSTRRAALIASLVRTDRPRPRPHVPAWPSARAYRWFSQHHPPRAHRLHQRWPRRTGRVVTGVGRSSPQERPTPPRPTRPAQPCSTRTLLYERMDG